MHHICMYMHHIHIFFIASDVADLNTFTTPPAGMRTFWHLAIVLQ